MQNTQKIQRAIGECGYFIANGIDASEVLPVASALGTIRVDPRHPHATRDIRPQREDEAAANTLSSRFGLGRFPFHTDTAHWGQPCRYLLLYCKHPGAGQRPTHLQDSRLWPLNHHFKHSIMVDVWKTGHFQPHLCTVAKLRADFMTVRFDTACMRPMTGSATHLRSFLNRCIENSPCIDIQWAAGTILVLDNHRMLHARGAAKEIDQDRVIQRVLIGGDE